MISGCEIAGGGGETGLGLIAGAGAAQAANVTKTNIAAVKNWTARVIFLHIKFPR
jgi:hypothetical protein